jgi:NADH:ubiquinone oxidoreductase subunit 2 (subunit N)
MLGVLVGLIGEATTGMGLLEQTAHHPITVFLSFVLISIATYVPLTK